MGSPSRRPGADCEGSEQGERALVSGNFLVDSESRMKLAAAGMYGEVSQDPVSRTYVDEDKAAAKGLESEAGGTPLFRSDQSQRLFDLNPDRS